MEVDYNKNLLDVFRIIATVQVFLGHMINHFTMNNAPFNIVYFVRGVPILFVLCGFLAAKSIEGRSVKDWLVSRAVRILPAFWVCIIFNTIIILIVYETKPTAAEALIYAVTQFFGLNFYTGDWLRGYGTGVPNGVLWTIPVQIQFFILVPLIHKFLSKKKLSVNLTFIALLTVISIVLEKASVFLPEIINKLIGVTVIPYLYFLVAGMVGWYQRDKIIPFLKKYKWCVLAFYIVWKLMEINIKALEILSGHHYNTVTTLLMAAVIFAFSFTGHWRMKRDLTYGFYLYHTIFINLALHFGMTSLEPIWRGIILTLSIAVLTVICALASRKFVEIPASKRLKRRKSHV